MYRYYRQATRTDMMRTDFAQTRRKHTLRSAHTPAQIFVPMLTHRHQHWHWRRHTLTTHTVIVYMRSCWRVLRSTVSGARMFVVVSCHHWSMSVFWSPSRLTQIARSPRRARRRVPVVTSAVGRKPCLQYRHNRLHWFYAWKFNKMKYKSMQL